MCINKRWKGFKNKLNKPISILIILIFFSSFFYKETSAIESEKLLLGTYSQNTSVQVTSNEALENARLILKYYYLKPVSDEVLNSSSIKEMLEKLEDPYSSYFTKEEYDGFVNNIENKFVGIGIQFEIDNKGVKITNVMDETPAKESGLKTGDIILEANSNILKGLPQEQIGSIIRGKEGTTVNLLIQRNNETLIFNITRKQIELSTVTYEKVNDLGYIYISSFGENTSKEFEEALNILIESKVEGYIVDLRYNSGGYIDTALSIGGYFLGEKSMLKMKNKAGYESVYKGINHNIIIDKPIIFLINKYSASASEILAAAVKDYGKAVFIGDNTYGKGVAQNMYILEDGNYIKITTHEFFSPIGKTINHVGISPDLLVDENYIDPLKIAKLMLASVGQENNIENLKNKDGYAKVKVSNSVYYINLSQATKDENWEVYKYILEKLGKENIFIGIEDKWVKANDVMFTNQMSLFYPKSKIFKEVYKGSDDKRVSVTFNNYIEKTTINDDNIQLIDFETGERISKNIIIEDNSKAIININEDLKQGKEYLLLIDDKVRNSKGAKLNKVTIVKVLIKN